MSFPHPPQQHLNLLTPVIAARQSEGNYKLIAQEVLSIMYDYNTMLCQQPVAGPA